MQHVMLDLETLGSVNNAAVITIGACVFEPRGVGVGECFIMCVDPEDAAKHGTVQGGTVLWWMQQSKAAQQASFNGTKKLKEVLEAFREWMPDDTAVWGNSSTFDNVVLRSAYHSVGVKAPWGYRYDKCYRTVINLAPKNVLAGHQFEGVQHNALDDAINQAVKLQKVFKALNL